MAKAKSAGNSVKVVFGKKKKGTAKKSRNKHESKQSKYKGQGR
jgi:hypothetical protein